MRCEPGDSSGRPSARVDEPLSRRQRARRASSEEAPVCANRCILTRRPSPAAPANASLTLCQAVSCKIDDATRIGYLSCGRCGQKFQCQTNPIMAAIDVYSEWIDATEEVNTAD